MYETAELYADRVVTLDDHPALGSTKHIGRDVALRVVGSETRDRDAAIRRALSAAETGDCVLVVADNTNQPTARHPGYSDDRHATRQWLYGTDYEKITRRAA